MVDVKSNRMVGLGFGLSGICRLGSRVVELLLDGPYVVLGRSGAGSVQG